jgi:hypothetical protein
MSNPTYLSQQPAQPSIASIAGKGGRIELPPVVKRNGTVGYVSAKPPAKPAAKSSPEELQERAAAAKRDAESRENARWFLEKYTEQLKDAQRKVLMEQDWLKQRINFLNGSLAARDKLQDDIGIGLNRLGIVLGAATGGTTAFVIGAIGTVADNLNSNMRIKNPGDEERPIAETIDTANDYGSTAFGAVEASGRLAVPKAVGPVTGFLGLGLSHLEAASTTALSISNAQAADLRQLQGLSKQVDGLTKAYGSVGEDAKAIQKQIGSVEDAQKEYAKAMSDYVFAVRNAEHWKVTLSSPR